MNAKTFKVGDMVRADNGIFGVGTVVFVMEKDNSVMVRFKSRVGGSALLHFPSNELEPIRQVLARPEGKS